MNGKRTYQTNGDGSFLYDDLKPCPCCGSSAKITFRGNSYTKFRSVEIKCNGCRLSRVDAGLRLLSQTEVAMVCIDQWNRRVEQKNS